MRIIKLTHQSHAVRPCVQITAHQTQRAPDTESYIAKVSTAIDKSEWYGRKRVRTGNFHGFDFSALYYGFECNQQLSV